MRTDDPRSIEDLEYAVTSLPLHLYKGGQHKRLVHLLTDYTFIESKLKLGGIDALLRDYDLGLKTHNAEGTVVRVQRALRLSRDILAGCPEQLRAQLLLRLDPNDIERLREASTSVPQRNEIILPLRPSLLRTDEALMDVVRGGSSCRDLAISKDWIARLSYNGTIAIWDRHKNSTKYILESPSLAGWTAVALTESGWALTGGGIDNSLALWALDQGNLSELIAGCPASINDVVVQPDGSAAYTACSDGEIRYWDLRSRSIAGSIGHHSARVNALTLTSNGREVVSVGDDDFVVVWELATGLEAFRIEGERHATYDRVAISSDGDWILATPQGGYELHAWRRSDGTARRLKGHRGRVRSVDTVPNSHLALSGSDDLTVRLWDLDCGHEIKSFVGHDNAVHAVAVAPDAKIGASSGEDGSLYVWNLEGSSAQRVGDHAQRISSVAIASDGKTGISGSVDGQVAMWQLESGVLRRVIAFGSAVKELTFVPGSTEYVVATGDGRIAIVDESGDRLWSVVDYDARGLLAIDNGRIVSGSDSAGTLSLWAPPSQTPQWVSPKNGRRTRLVPIAVSLDGKSIVARSDSELVIADAATGVEVRRYDGMFYHDSIVYYLPRAECICCAERDTFRIYDLKSGKRSGSLRVSRHNITAAAISETISVSADDNCNIRVWSMPDVNEIARLTVDSTITVCAYSIEHRIGLFGDALGRVHIVSA